MKNYGWPTGPATIWLWLARRPIGWPDGLLAGLGQPGHREARPLTYGHFMNAPEI